MSKEKEESLLNYDIKTNKILVESGYCPAIKAVIAIIRDEVSYTWDMTDNIKATTEVKHD